MLKSHHILQCLAKKKKTFESGVTNSGGKEESARDQFDKAEHEVKM